MKLPRWRPVCPECGYSLRGLTADRCPECGEPFPTTQRTFRRWAHRRLPWDRRHRTSLLRAYFATVFLILFCPWKAARGLVIPDRWGRAVRWAAGHAVGAAVLDALTTGPQRGFLSPRLGRALATGEPPPILFGWTDKPIEWFVQSLVAWLFVLLLIPTLGALLSLGQPGEHRAAKWGSVKLCLYISALVPLLLFLWIAGQALWGLVSHGAGMDSVFYSMLPVDSSFPLFLGAAVFGTWMGAGMAMNPYREKREPAIAVGWAVAFCAAWLLCTCVLFPLGPLGDLL